MIEKAFRCACVTHHGVPTEDAQDAVEWITCHLDWTHDHGSSIPPAPLRAEFIMSYEYCCAALGLDADETRRCGLPRDVATLAPSKRRLRTRPRVDRGRNARAHVAGLTAVYACWERAAERHAAEIDAHECVDTAPLSEADSACLVSV